MSILRFFWWLIFPAALVLVYLIFGLPYLSVSYDFRSGAGYDPWAERYYLRCTYWNPTDTQTIHPRDGKCPRIKFFKPDSGRN